jgi:hypothetical protein
MLYHSAIVSAARERGWNLLLHRRGEELARAADALRVSVDDVERFINDLRSTLKSPWTSEHRHACAAAIAGLAEQSRLRPLRIEPDARATARQASNR